MINQKLKLLGVWVFASVLSGCFLPNHEQSGRLDPNINLGMAYLVQSDLENARFALNEALKASPGSADGWGAKGYLEELSGNLTLAGQAYRHAIQINPKLGEAHNNYGIFLCRHGYPRLGLNELLKALQFPDYVHRATAFENAGICALKIPDIPAAQVYFAAARRNGLSMQDPNRAAL